MVFRICEISLPIIYRHRPITCLSIRIMIACSQYWLLKAWYHSMRYAHMGDCTATIILKYVTNNDKDMPILIKWKLNVDPSHNAMQFANYQMCFNRFQRSCFSLCVIWLFTQTGLVHCWSLCNIKCETPMLRWLLNLVISSQCGGTKGIHVDCIFLQKTFQISQMIGHPSRPYTCSQIHQGFIRQQFVSLFANLLNLTVLAVVWCIEFRVFEAFVFYCASIALRCTLFHMKRYIFNSSVYQEMCHWARFDQ